MTTKRLKKIGLILVLIAVVLIITVPLIVMEVSKAFTAQEHVVRTDWSFETGDIIAESAEWQVDFTEAQLGDGLRAVQLVPQDIGEEDFTFYDRSVQERLDGALQSLKTMSDTPWTGSMPLAVLNPFGTGSNGLYLYFETEQATQVSYTVHVDDEDIPDFTASAADSSGQAYTKVHEFQLIGLVPGETNYVTMTITGRLGNTRQLVRFKVDMPDTSSGYDTRLEVTEGTSDQTQADGLFAMMRVNGYLGYGFFYDDAGILRYEMCWRASAWTASSSTGTRSSPVSPPPSWPGSTVWAGSPRSMTFRAMTSTTISASAPMARCWPWPRRPEING